MKRGPPAPGSTNLTVVPHYRTIIGHPITIPRHLVRDSPDSKVHGANMGPTWVLSAPDGPHVGPMNLCDINLCDIFTHPCPNFHGGLAKPPLKLKQGFVITSYIKPRMCLILVFYFQLMVPDKSKFKKNIKNCLSDYHIPRCQNPIYASLNYYHEGYSCLSLNRTGMYIAALIAKITLCMYLLYFIVSYCTVLFYMG